MQYQTENFIRNSLIKLADNEIWIVVFIVGMSVIFPELLSIAFGIILLFWFIRWFVGGRFSLRTPVDIIIVSLIPVLILNLWASISLQTTIPQVLRLLTGIGLFYAIINWTLTVKKIRKLVLGLALFAIFLSIYGLFSVEWNPSKIPIIPQSIYEFIPTLLSDVVHRNVMGGMLIIIFPCVLALLIFESRHLSRLEIIIYSISILTSAAVLILTQTRAAWISLIFIFLILAGLKLEIRIRHLFILIIISAAIIFVGRELIIYDLNVSKNLLQGIEGRFEIWNRAIAMIQDFPITGIGMGLFGKFADELYPFIHYSPGSIPHAHNVFLQVAVDLGFPGLIAWLAMFICICYLALRLFIYSKKNEIVWVTGLSAGLLTGQIALVIHGIFDSVIWGMIRPSPIVWALWGLILASFLIIKNTYQKDRIENRGALVDHRIS